MFPKFALSLSCPKGDSGTGTEMSFDHCGLGALEILTGDLQPEWDLLSRFCLPFALGVFSFYIGIWAPKCRTNLPCPTGLIWLSSPYTTLSFLAPLTSYTRLYLDYWFFSIFYLIWSHLLPYTRNLNTRSCSRASSPAKISNGHDWQHQIAELLHASYNDHHSNQLTPEGRDSRPFALSRRNILRPPDEPIQLPFPVETRLTPTFILCRRP